MQVCSELSKEEGETSLRGVGGFLMRCQEKSKLNSLHLHRATQWVKSTVRMEKWTPNTGNILWTHCTLTCRVIRLTLSSSFCTESTKLNFSWYAAHPRVTDWSFWRPRLWGRQTQSWEGFRASEVTQTHLLDIQGHKRSHLCLSNYSFPTR